jgi:cell division septation protein DedD
LRRLRTEYPLSPYLRIGYLPQDPSGHRRPEGEEFAIQIGAFANRDNAIRLRDTLAGRSYAVDIFENFIDGKRLYYLVWVGTFKTMAEAEKEAERMRSVDRIFGVVRQRNMAR